MTKYLPPRLRDLFAPRPPLEYLPPATFRKMPAYTGVSAFLNRFEDPATSEAPTEEPIEILTPAEIRLKKRKRAAEDHEEEVAKKFKLCKFLNLVTPIFLISERFPAESADISHLNSRIESWTD